MRGIEAAQRHYTVVESHRLDSIAFLLPTQEWSIELAEQFVEAPWPHFFTQALTMWDEQGEFAPWPEERSHAMFKKWFDAQISDMVLALGGYED